MFARAQLQTGLDSMVQGYNINMKLFPNPRHPLLSVLLSVLLITGLSQLVGCAATEVPGVYRIDVQQGNIITSDMLARLEPGMNKRKVRFILGTPLIADAFNSERWDYIYTFRTGTDQRLQRNVTAIFENERLLRLEGDIEGSISPTRTVPERQDRVVRIIGPREPRGLLESLSTFSDDGPTAAEKAAEEAAASKSASDEAANGATTASLSDAASDNLEATNAEADAASDGASAPEVTALDPPSVDDVTTQNSASPSLWDRFTDTLTGGPDDTADVREIAAPVEPVGAPSIVTTEAPKAIDVVPVNDSSSGLDGGFFARLQDRLQRLEIPEDLLKITPPSDDDLLSGDR